ncbi:MAG: DUF1631 domain-containing protein [Lysobacterales bacterium]
MNRPSTNDSPYHSCAKTYLRGMAGLLQGLFESVDNALFEMAEKADSNAMQTHYFDGMRQVRKTRSGVENAILKSLRRQLIDYQKGVVRTPENEAPITEDTLSLVDESELERNLAISEMVAKGENRLSRPLFAISQRIGEATGKTPPDDADNPLGPAIICTALQDASPQFEIELPVLLVIYKLFDRSVLENLDGVYEQVNAGFINAGVMPALQHRVSTAGASRPPGTSTGAPDAPPNEAVETSPAESSDVDQTPSAMPEDAGADPANAKVLESILSLLSARHGPVQAAAGHPVQSDATPAGNDNISLQTNVSNASQTQQLLNALSVLQSNTEVPQQSADEVKRQVLNELGKLGDQTQTSSDEEDTIDLVAMLFEFILSDPNLPQPMQVMLARLQIPYIKVALIDRQLFASRNHPARKLLDTLADLALGWSAETDRGNRLHQHMERVVERVIRDFDEDLTLFDTLRDELNEFVGRLQKRASVAEKRTTEATEGKQRLQQARRMASDIVDSYVGDQELPSIVTEILSKPWANVLVLTCLRHGIESKEFDAAKDFVHKLIWSTEPKTEKAEVSKLQAELPGLTAQLRNGLEMVAYHQDDIKRVFASLKALYRSMLDSQYRDQIRLKDKAPPPTMSLPAAVAPVQLPISGAADLQDSVFDSLADEPEPIALEELEEVLREQVQSLNVGTWFQFSTENGQPQRAKLSWKSPITGKYLFVDNKGIKIADKPVAVLAQDLANGEVIALETVPLFDRALSAIAERLGDSETETPE